MAAGDTHQLARTSARVALHRPLKAGTSTVKGRYDDRVTLSGPARMPPLDEYGGLSAVVACYTHVESSTSTRQGVMELTYHPPAWGRHLRGKSAIVIIIVITCRHQHHVSRALADHAV